MSSIETLPIIPFGKHKDKPITELMCDTEYLKWLSLQPWFKEKYPTIYNITINQTINNTQSKTPDHNKIQNMFLEENFCISILDILYKNDIINDFIILYKLVSDDDNKDIIMEIANKYIKKVDAEFEYKYNWDVVLFPQINFKSIILPIDRKIISSELKTINLYKGNEEGITECKYKKELEYRICIEIKPILGDDYPSVLRKMKMQRELMYTPRIERRRNGNFYHEIKHYTDPCIFVLLIKEFKSETTSEQQLVKIFKQSNIKVIFL